MQTPLSIKETLYLSIINKKIKQEIEECIFRLNLKALLPFISIIQETAREAIIKEEVFDHCNKKLIDLQENYKDNITNEQQKQIDELQNTINYFYHNPKEVIQQIVDYSFQLDKLKESSIKKKGEIYLIIKKIGQQKKSLATSKNILLEEYYIEYINQKNNKIFLLTEQLSINENETKINNNKLLIQLYKLAELKNNLSQVKEYLTKLNQQSSELELEKNRAKEENNQENIKLIEEKISENISEFNSNQELIINLSNNINAINNEIKDINNILSQLKDTQETVEKNITNEKTKIDNTKQKLELEQKEKNKNKYIKNIFFKFKYI